MKMFNFDPTEVAKYELGWWRAHNEKNSELLFELLVKQHVVLYGFSVEEAQDALQHFAKAVKFHDTDDWDQAIKAINPYYQVIKEKIRGGFKSEQAASLEIGWWRLHDELEFEDDKTRLAEAFSELYACIFNVQKEDLSDAGKYKMKATREHDLAEEDGISFDKSEKHWQAAGKMLEQFYQELFKVVHN